MSEPVLDTALDQLHDLFDALVPHDLSRPVPCAGWTVADLTGHVVKGVRNFAVATSGGRADWSAPTPPLGPAPVTEFDAAADELRRAWQQPSEQAMPDWQLAELAVHTWDLARGLGRDTVALDQDVATRGLAFMQANLADDMRGEAFGPAQEAPDDADAYGRIAAFAGRSV